MFYKDGFSKNERTYLLLKLSKIVYYRKGSTVKMSQSTCKLIEGRKLVLSDIISYFSSCVCGNRKKLALSV